MFHVLVGIVDVVDGFAEYIHIYTYNMGIILIVYHIVVVLLTTWWWYMMHILHIHNIMIHMYTQHHSRSETNLYQHHIFIFLKFIYYLCAIFIIFYMLEWFWCLCIYISMCLFIYSCIIYQMWLFLDVLMNDKLELKLIDYM